MCIELGIIPATENDQRILHQLTFQTHEDAFVESTDEISNSILRKELTQVVQINLEYSSEFFQFLLLLGFVIDIIVSNSLSDSHFDTDNTGFSFKEHLQ